MTIICLHRKPETNQCNGTYQNTSKLNPTQVTPVKPKLNPSFQNRGTRYLESLKTVTYR
ncbi:hypothetical protein VCRA2116O30_150089 [Vibrio crassostreae]|nr:hypothetical protein VCRA2116O27_130045 [Vibrio crassostreae]CAK1746561.1 hypothetical protein VCRA2119O44_130045 [Vibrio crassostreae]CAK1746637.1 hypothetical protein VCRA2116O28_130045 [Vibrio crassostreae]CAK1750472.1 hypothetical protein VCRA2119O47_130089 [Vibrio crassostreae]CAK1750507.1 hypothetical protein VCRA2118O41_130089 [Vibrio crassostreae]